jgi:hypothetical protein
LVVLLFPILFLCARVFTRIYSGDGQEGYEGAQKRKENAAMVAAEEQ